MSHSRLATAGYWDAAPIDYADGIHFSINAVAIKIIYRFRENIQRLASGTERRLGDHDQSSE
jgi:glycerol-3-phosphate acyltransferase PlsY